MTTKDDAPFRYVSEVPQAALDALAAMLTMPPSHLDARTGLPSREWLTGQKAKLQELPSGLLRPPWLLGLSKVTGKVQKGFRKRLPGVIPSGKPVLLCDTHAELNPRLVRSVFEQLCEEVGCHADEIRAHAGRYADDATVRGWGDRMFGVSALWSNRDMFRELASRAFPRAVRLPCLKVICEACGLAAVGARGQLLADLRAGLRSRALLEERERARRRASAGEDDDDDDEDQDEEEDDDGDVEKPTPRRPQALERFVEAWVDLFGETNAAVLRAQSEVLAETLFRVRRHEASWRRGTRRRYKVAVRLGDGAGLTMARFRAAKDHDPTAEKRPPIYTPEGHLMPMPWPAPLDDSDSEPDDRAERARRRERYRHVDGHYDPPPAERRQPDFHSQDDDGEGDGDDDGSRDEEMQRWLDGTTHDAEAFQHDSAVPRPLTIKKDGRGHDRRNTVADGSGGSWVSATVHTFDDGPAAAAASSVYSTDKTGGGSGAGTYVPARAGWGKPAAAAAVAADSYLRLQDSADAAFGRHETDDGSVAPDDSVSVAGRRRAEGRGRFARVAAAVDGSQAGGARRRASRSTHWPEAFAE